MTRKTPHRIETETITAETALPYLAAGYVFTFHSLSQGWYCKEKNLILPCKEYDSLRKRRLIDNGQAWSPEQEQERQDKFRSEARKNQEARLQHYYDRLVDAFDSLGTQRQRVFEVLSDIWSRAANESISDPFTK